MYHGSATGWRCCIRAGQTLRVHSPGRNTFLREMAVIAAILKVWRQIEIRLRQLMRIYLKNNLAKLHPDPVWNDGALGFFGEVAPNIQKNKMSSDMISVPGPKIMLQLHSNQTD